MKLIKGIVVGLICAAVLAVGIICIKAATIYIDYKDAGYAPKYGDCVNEVLDSIAGKEIRVTVPKMKFDFVD